MKAKLYGHPALELMASSGADTPVLLDVLPHQRGGINTVLREAWWSVRIIPNKYSKFTCQFKLIHFLNTRNLSYPGAMLGTGHVTITKRYPCPQVAYNPVRARTDG